MLLTPEIRLERDLLATIAVSAAPVVLEGRYPMLMQAPWQLQRSRRTRWGFCAGSVAVMLVLAVLPVCAQKPLACHARPDRSAALAPLAAYPRAGSLRAPHSRS
jgi:hypothetical protein